MRSKFLGKSQVSSAAYDCYDNDNLAQYHMASLRSISAK